MLTKQFDPLMSCIYCWILIGSNLNSNNHYNKISSQVQIEINSP